MADLNARFADVIAKNPTFKGATGLMAMNYEGSFVYGEQDPRSRLLTSLGFKLPDDLAAVTGDQFGVNISKERTDLLDTDAWSGWSPITTRTRRPCRTTPCTPRWT